MKQEKSIVNADPDLGELNANYSTLVPYDDSDSVIADVDRSTIADNVDKSTLADIVDKSTVMLSISSLNQRFVKIQ